MNGDFDLLAFHGHANRGNRRQVQGAAQSLQVERCFLKVKCGAARQHAQPWSARELVDHALGDPLQKINELGIGFRNHTRNDRDRIECALPGTRHDDSDTFSHLDVCGFALDRTRIRSERRSDPPKLVPNIGDSAITAIAIFLQSFSNYRFDFGKSRRSGFDLGRIEKKNGSDGCLRRVSIERAPPAHHLVQHHAKTEDVAARIESLAPKLFRRHVRSSPRHHAGPREKVCLLGLLIEHFGQTEIENLHISTRRHDDVRRLYVAVDDSAVVCRLERFADLDGAIERSLESQLSAVEA